MNQSTYNKDSKLTQADRILLAELEDDARKPLSIVAKRLRISQQLLSYRLQSLQKINILAGYYTQINFTMFGYTRYRTMIRLSNYSRNKSDEIVDYLMNHPNVQWFVECGGRWDFLVNFMAKNIIQFSNFLKDFRKTYPRQIQNVDVLTVVEVIELGRSYFIKSHRDIEKLSYFGRDFEAPKIDNIDLMILDYISENTRMTSAQISEMLEVSPNTVSVRIKNLLKKGVIRGFKPLIHLENTLYSTCKALIAFQNATEEREVDIIDYVKTDVNFVASIKLVGEWDFEVEFEVDSREAMLNLTRAFRDEFKDVIKELRSFLYIMSTNTIFSLRISSILPEIAIGILHCPQNDHALEFA